jgi:transcriptional regulator with XRE-family HTH domain
MRFGAIVAAQRSLLPMRKGMPEMSSADHHDETDGVQVTFAQKLNKLMEVIARENGKPMTAARFLADFTAKTGASISAGYLSELRTGKVSAPRIDLVDKLAAYFKVNPSYFLAGPADIENQARLDLLASMRDNQVHSLAIRAAGLSESALRRLAIIIESNRAMENLPATPGDETLENPS